MKCMYCGAELPEDSVFCANCGAKLEGAAETERTVEEEKTAETERTVEEEKTAEPETMTETVEPTESAAAGKPLQTTESGMQPEKRKGNVLIPIILGFVAIVLIVVIALVVLLINNSSNGNEKELVYQKDGEIFYVKNMDSDKEAVSVCDVRGAENAYNHLTLSSDGKYLYYLDRLETDGSGDLYRAELRKLKNDSDKNEKYNVKIDSKVYSYQILENGRQVVYEKTNGKLVYFDGEKEEDIARDVSSYSWYLSEDQTVTYEKEKGDGAEIVCYDLKSGEETILAENVSYVENGLYQSDFIVYSKVDKNAEDDTYDIYYTSVDNEEDEKIAGGVEYTYGCNAGEKSLYYVVKRQEESSLYDFFVDDTASEAAMTEPTVSDFLQPSTQGDAMSEYDLEYYSEYPEELADFYSCLSYDDQTGLYYYYKEIDWFEYEIYYYNDQTKEWFLFDEDAYAAAYDKYENVAYRQEMIDALKQETIVRDYYDLYYWKEGSEAVLVTENVSVESIIHNTDTSLIFYQKIETKEGAGIPLSQIGDYYTAWDYYDEALDNVVLGDTIYYYNGSAEAELDENGNLYGADISEDHSQVVLTLGDAETETAICYELSKGSLNDGKEVSDEAVMGTWSGDIYYYFEDVIDSYGDLYSYKNGKSERVLRDVYIGDVRVYSDGNFMAFDDYDYLDGGELKVYSGQKDGQKIGNAVQQYTYIDADRIVYMKNDSLYVYNGKKEDTRIARNVDDYICHGMDFDWIN